MSKLTLYPPHPINRDDVLKMVATLDDAIGVFRDLGLPGHELCHGLHSFRKDLLTSTAPSDADVMVWPDNTWCHRAELAEYAWKSDDFRVIHWGTPEYTDFWRDK